MEARSLVVTTTREEAGTSEQDLMQAYCLTRSLALFTDVKTGAQRGHSDGSRPQSSSTILRKRERESAVSLQ